MQSSRRLDIDDVAQAIARAEALVRGGRFRDACEGLRAAVAPAGNDVVALKQMGGLFSAASSFADAARCYEVALKLAPRDVAVLQAFASARTALGALDEAEELLDRALALRPDLYGTWHVRASLRRQTRDSNHVAAIRMALRKAAPEGESALQYALAKELEDLGEFEASFRALQRGASLRRARMQYDVRADVAVMSSIAATFTDEWLRARRGSGDPRRDPVFVMGLPRSGTTLTDRIVSSHPAVQSLGEIPEWAMAVMDLAMPARSKEEVLARSSSIEPAALGRRYLERVAGYDRSAPQFIDKTPLNFLYLGLIVAALPNAPILHMRRAPMDVCYALYKMPFQMAAPFSYDLGDLAHYYIAYDALMRHWREIASDTFIDVVYEQLTAQQERESRRVVAHCGLPWDEACLRFEKNSAPTATASAAQVREGIHRRSVDQWRAYAPQLAPLCEQLSAAGIDVAAGGA